MPHKYTSDERAEYIALQCKQAKKVTEGWMALCPAHDDTTASLSIRPGNVKARLKCFSNHGCTEETIMAALGLTKADLLVSPPRQYDKQEAIYRYESRDGAVVHETVRYRKANGAKTFKQRRPDPTKPRQYIWDLKDIETVLYHLPQVLSAIKNGEPIYVVEGEKDVDSLMKLGLTATCNPMGAGKWKPHYSAMLAGAHIIILPDNDKAGRDHAQDVARDSLGTCASIVILALPDVPDKGDVSDWLQKGHTRVELEALVKSAKTYTPGADDPTPQAPPQQEEPVAEDASPQEVAETLLARLGSLDEDAQVDAIIAAMPALAGLDTLRWMKVLLQLKAAVPSINRNMLEHARKEYLQASGTDKPEAAQAQLAADLEREYAETWAFDLSRQSWMTYAEGFWQPRETERINQDIGHYMDERLDRKYGWNTMSGVEHLLRTKLPRTFPFAPAGWLPFRNGALCLETMQLHPHRPAYAFTWQLPHDYDAQADCPKTQAWLHEVVGGFPDQVQLLRAYIKAVITRRVDLERYLEMIGPGGTGKSTYTRLLTAVVGDDNTYATELKHLEANRFETSSLRGKVLMLVTDAERYSGPVNQLKAIVGEDLVRMEGKYKDPKSEMAPVMVAIAANEPIQSADYTSGLERRRLSMAFRHRPAKPRRLLEFRAHIWHGELVAEIPGVINWALALPDTDMEALVRDTAQTVPSLKATWALALIETNPLADWANQWLIHAPALGDDGDPLARVNVGVADKKEHPARGYERQEDWLYPNYRAWVDATGQKYLSQRRFKSLLEDLLVQQLRQLPLEHVFHRHDRNGSQFFGIELRLDGDTTSSLLITRDPVQEKVVMEV